MSRARVAFSLAIPPSWSELDLNPRTRDRSIATIVEERFREVPGLRERRPEIVAYLRDTARAAWDAGCRYCGTFVEAAADGIVPGSITVSILPPAPATGSRNPLDDVVEQLNRIHRTQTNDYWHRTTTVTLTHARDAARTFGVQPLQLQQGRPSVPAAVMHTFVPFEGGVALIAAGSPATEVAEPLFELFDAVTDTFRLHPLPEDTST